MRLGRCRFPNPAVARPELTDYSPAPRTGRDEGAQFGVILTARSRLALDPAGHVDRERTHLPQGLRDVARLQPAGKHGRRVGSHEARRQRPVERVSRAAVGVGTVGVEEQVVRAETFRRFETAFVAHADRLDERQARRLQRAAERFVLVAVELNRVDDPLAQQPLDLLRRRVDDHSDPAHPEGQRAQPGGVAREVQAARRSGVEIQPERVRAEFNRERGVVGVRDPANFDPGMPGRRVRKDHGRLRMATPGRQVSTLESRRSMENGFGSSPPTPGSWRSSRARGWSP